MRKLYKLEQFESGKQIPLCFTVNMYIFLWARLIVCVQGAHILYFLFRMRAQRCTTAYDFCIKPGKHNLGCGNTNYKKDTFWNNTKQV